MGDPQQKDHRHGKSTTSKSKQMKHHHQNQGHRHHQKLLQSDYNESPETQSTAEDSICTVMKHPSPTAAAWKKDKSSTSTKTNNRNALSEKHGGRLSGGIQNLAMPLHRISS
ncbi:hypothetical protein KUCAC02_003390 [Chaenocephalus aceratus]|uniref:Uncharacterized protein n=1 Tax=Chaenocephalus aceratus TaxID=36190 RepID=A0ACB9WLE6_CHAAC|nr:hypothetical protein KUCAC02_003390 [Chaenocephalus aceratus]